VLLDVRMPGMDGMETLKRIKEIDDAIEVIMVTAVNDVQKAGEAITLGANNYIVKPFDVEQILSMTKALLNKKMFKKEAGAIQKEAKRERSDSDIIGSSKQVLEILKKIDTLGSNDAPVLIIGPAGSEKSEVASAIHKKCARSQSPIFEISLSKDLSEEYTGNILFGTGKGSFINELTKDKGIFELSSGGSIVINNIENASLSTQSLILDIIRNKLMRRKGSSTPINIDIRVIVTTGLDLKQLSDEGKFSKELLEVFSEGTVILPALSDRAGDIADISAHLLEKYNQNYNKSIKEVSKNTLEAFSYYKFSGNYAELRDIIENAVIASTSDTIKLGDVPMSVLSQIDYISSLDENKAIHFDTLNNMFEREYIFNTLKKTNFDLQSASQILGINQNILSSKIESLEIK